MLFFLACWEGDDDRTTFVILILVISATDFFDGILARHWGESSTLGKILDPLCDKLCIVLCVGGLVLFTEVPLSLATALIAREIIILIMALRFGKKTLNWVPLQPNQWGKWGTATLITGIGFYIIALPSIGFAFSITGISLYIVANHIYILRITRRNSNLYAWIASIFTITAFLLPEITLYDTIYIDFDLFSPNIANIS